MDTFQPRNLFGDLKLSDRNLRAQIEDRLIGLAQAGELCLTELLLAPAKARDVAGQVLLGHQMEDRSGPLGTASNPVEGAEVPEELRSYRVKMTVAGAAAEDPDFSGYGLIKWSDGSETLGWRAAKGSAHLGLAQDNPQSVRLISARQKQVACPPGEVVELPVRDAWLALKQSGKHVAYAQRTNMRQRRWLCAEVLPSHEQAVEPAGPKPKGGVKVGSFRAQRAAADAR